MLHNECEGSTPLLSNYVRNRIKVSSKTQFQKAPNTSQEVTSNFMCSIRPVVKLAAWILGESGALKLQLLFFTYCSMFQALTPPADQFVRLFAIALLILRT